MHKQFVAIADRLAVEILIGLDDEILVDAYRRRATSSAYYAPFDAFSAEAADLLAGRGTAEWKRVYRSLDHRRCKDACGRLAKSAEVAPGLQDCAATVPGLQEARHCADYDPDWTPDTGTVLAHIATAERAITALINAPEAARRAFVLCLLLQGRH